MEKKIRRVVERPSGTGTLFRKEDPIGKVSYNLTVSKEFIVIENFGEDRSEVEGMGEINGTVTFFGDGVGFMPEGNFRLKLEDGRELVIFLHPGQKTHKIAVRDASNFSKK